MAPFCSLQSPPLPVPLIIVLAQNAAGEATSRERGPEVPEANLRDHGYAARMYLERIDHRKSLRKVLFVRFA